MARLAFSLGRNCRGPCQRGEPLIPSLARLDFFPMLKLILSYHLPKRKVKLFYFTCNLFGIGLG